jgi:hypothetical protein
MGPSGSAASLPENIRAVISAITKIELPAYPNLTKQKEYQIRLLLKNQFRAIPLSWPELPVETAVLQDFSPASAPLNPGCSL